VVLPEVGSDDATPLGMGYSIGAGVSARPDASGWLILPGDMPMVQPATLRAVARELTASFMADTPPEKRSQQALDKWCAEFEEGSWRSVKHLTPKRRQRTHRRFGG